MHKYLIPNSCQNISFYNYKNAKHKLLKYEVRLIYVHCLNRWQANEICNERKGLTELDTRSAWCKNIYLFLYLQFRCLYSSDSRNSDCLRAGRSEDRIPVGGEIFRTSPDRPWGPPSLLYNGYRVFPGGKVRPGRDAPHQLLVQRSKIE